MPIIKWGELINTKKFAKIVLDENFEIFMIYIATLEALLAGMSIHLDKKAQIASLLIKKIMILDKYFNFVDPFSKKEDLDTAGANRLL